jgi:hypothetical protein
MFFSNTKLFLHNQSNQQVVATPSKTKVLQCLPNPEVNSPTNEKYYEDKKGLKQYVCGLKPHGENDI